MSLRRALAACTLFTMCHSPLSRAESILENLWLTRCLEAPVKRLIQFLSRQNTVTDFFYGHIVSKASLVHV